MRFSQYVARTGNSIEDSYSVERYWQEQAAISDGIEPPITKDEVASRLRGQQEFIETKIEALETKYQIEYSAPEAGEFQMKALDEPVGLRVNDDSFRFLNPNDPYTNWSVSEIEGVQNQVFQNKTLFDDTIDRYNQANKLLDLQMNDLQNESGFRKTLSGETKLLRAAEVSEILDDNAFNQSTAEFGHSDIAEQLSKVEVADGIDETVSIINVTEAGSEGIKVSKLDSLEPGEIDELKDAIVESTAEAAAAEAAEAAEAAASSEAALLL